MSPDNMCRRHAPVLRLLWVALAMRPGLGGASAQTHDHSGSTPDEWVVGDVPTPDIGAATLAARAAAERATAGEFGVFNGFRFTDRLPESGITFVHGVVDDAAKMYKAAHYDHGTGLAVADVDGDGRLDLYFVNQRGGSELWRNLGGGRFEDVTARAGVGLPDRISVSASFADTDNDGDPDLYVTTVRGGNVLFENDGQGCFKDVTSSSGLGYVGHSSGAVFFDFDRDGRLDLFLVNVGKYTTESRGAGGYYVAFEDAFKGHLFPDRTEKSVLYRNAGGNRFVDVSSPTGLEDGSWSGDATIADWNGDGWPDLYVLNMQGDDHFYENVEGKRFVDATASYFPKTPWGAMGIKVFDWNNDGRMDLLVTDMHSDMVGKIPVEGEKRKFPPRGDPPELQGAANNIFGNAFFENRGGTTFVERSDEVNLENYWPWGVSVDDLNADGWEDVFITASMNFPWRYGINSLLLNDHGERFRDSAFLLGIEPRRDGRTRKPWFRLDCGGEDRGIKRCQGRSGRFVITGTLGSRSSAIFDLDDDGDLDIVTNEFNSEPQVFVSDLAQVKPVHWLRVKLVGRSSNRDGIGALVRVKAGAQTLTRVMDGNSGYLSHSLIPLYFGLGDAARAEALEVVWPSGMTQALPGPIAADRQIEVREDVPGAKPR